MIMFELMDDTWTLGLSVAALVVMLGLYRSISAHRDKRNKLYPPMAPTGFWQTINAMAGDDNPWFLLRTSLRMGVQVFRLPVQFLGGPLFAVVGDAKLARIILNDKETNKPIAMYRSFDYLTNGAQSLFSNNGPFWHVRRKGVAPAFSSNHVQRMNAVAVAKCDKWIEERLKPLIDEGKSFDVGDEMIDLLLTAICETAFEYTISPMEVKMFKHELEIALREFLFRTHFQPWRKVLGRLLPAHRRARLAAERIQGLGFRIIEAYKKLENPTQGTIINLIMCNQAYKNDAERTADIAILLVAGHDTTAYTLAWTLKELAQNPIKQAELRRSIREDDLQAPHQLETVRSTIREGIRLHPVSGAGSARLTGKDFVTKDGKLIPAGSITIMSYMIMLRDPSVFGKDYDQFNPSRWEKATPEMNQAFLPFSAGRQNCVGQPLANAELHCILPRIISQFELTVDEPGHCECFLTIKPVNTMLRAKPCAQS
ncbi:hydroxyvitamin D-1 alpha hydroxylase, mitochondrial [Seminavis robusta]|uniref:Hydroxyvitamin D-1 alpha hydroxylase, mitochondrial n=1 Tax=Seminavis robusta TaxID=568900 RepID=A0A9N8F0J8_9STRA|nr:hydroxyvitamin D-1 alpha hydroxylase, mitochondrial [Seminavis robusta]|eukprot:Sro2418_g327010.1 hydroxyvitamin D-1 alpha hydroxylase, mitochondrial (484) ;mRNA; f:10864-12605